MQASMKGKNGLKNSGTSADRPATANFAQSREFYRVNLDAPMEWQILDPLGQELDTHEGEVTNLSGGGLAFTSNCAAAPGDRMHILLTGLPLIDKLDTYVTVLRVTPLEEDDQPSVWQMACELDELTPRHRDRLISSIFEQQRRDIFNARQEQEQAKAN